MRQPIVGGIGESCTTWVTQYCLLMGAKSWNPDETTVYEVIPTSGTISNLYVHLSANVAAGATISFSLMVNGIASLLTCTLAAGESDANLVGHGVNVSEGDTVTICSTNTGTPGTPFASWSTIFEGNKPGESICLASLEANRFVTKYFTLQGYGDGGGVLAQMQTLMPIGGTFKSLYVKLSEDPGTPVDAYSITLQVDGVDSALTCTVVANDTTGDDIVNTVVVTSSNLINLEVTPISTPSKSPFIAVGLVFVSDTDGESLIIGGYENSAPGLATGFYHLVTGGGMILHPVEAQRTSLIQACKLYNLTAYMDIAPGVGESRQWDLRLSEADSGLSILISDADTYGRDITNSAIATDGEVCSMKHTPSAAPTASFGGHWAVVAYLLPIEDVDAIIRAYLITQSDLTDLVSTRIYCPRLPENATLPAVSFFVRGGTANPHIAPVVSPSVQFDCWADNPIEARKVYQTLYSVLQGIQQQAVHGKRILSAREEVQGMDMVDVEIPNYFRVLSFFEVMIALRL